jgi:hypothetical protein
MLPKEARRDRAPLKKEGRKERKAAEDHKKRSIPEVFLQNNASSRFM